MNNCFDEALEAIADIFTEDQKSVLEYQIGTLTFSISKQLKAIFPSSKWILLYNKDLTVDKAAMIIEENNLEILKIKLYTDKLDSLADSDNFIISTSGLEYDDLDSRNGSYVRIDTTKEKTNVNLNQSGEGQRTRDYWNLEAKFTQRSSELLNTYDKHISPNLQKINNDVFTAQQRTQRKQLIKDLTSKKIKDIAKTLLEDPVPELTTPDNENSSPDDGKPKTIPNVNLKENPVLNNYSYTSIANKNTSNNISGQGSIKRTTTADIKLKKLERYSEATVINAALEQKIHNLRKRFFLKFMPLFYRL